MQETGKIVEKIEDAIAENVDGEEVMSTVETVVHAIDSLAHLAGNILDVTDGI